MLCFPKCSFLPLALIQKWHVLLSVFFQGTSCFVFKKPVAFFYHLVDAIVGIIHIKHDKALAVFTSEYDL